MVFLVLLGANRARGKGLRLARHRSYAVRGVESHRTSHGQGFVLTIGGHVRAAHLLIDILMASSTRA